MLAIFLGILWGFIEATLGGAMHFFMAPYTGPILGSIGCSILYFALRRGVSVRSLLVITLIAAGMKFFDIFLFKLALSEVTVVRPAAAILMQGCAFTFIAAMDKGFAIKRVPIYATVIAFASVFGFAALYVPHIQMDILYSVAIMAVLTASLIYAVHASEGMLQKVALRPVPMAALSAILVVATAVLQLLIGH